MSSVKSSPQIIPMLIILGRALQDFSKSHYLSVKNISDTCEDKKEWEKYFRKSKESSLSREAGCKIESLIEELQNSTFRKEFLNYFIQEEKGFQKKISLLVGTLGTSGLEKKGYRKRQGIS